MGVGARWSGCGRATRRGGRMDLEGLGGTAGKPLRGPGGTLRNGDAGLGGAGAGVGAGAARCGAVRCDAMRCWGGDEAGNVQREAMSRWMLWVTGQCGPGGDGDGGDGETKKKKTRACKRHYSR